MSTRAWLLRSLFSLRLVLAQGVATTLTAQPASLRSAQVVLKDDRLVFLRIVDGLFTDVHFQELLQAALELPNLRCGTDPRNLLLHHVQQPVADLQGAGVLSWTMQLSDRAALNCT